MAHGTNGPVLPTTSNPVKVDPARKVGVKSVVLSYGEGLSKNSDLKVEVKNFREAGAVLGQWAWELYIDSGRRPSMGYYKQDFVVTWEDGETYEGRADIEPPKHFTGYDLAGHVRDFLTFMSGQRCPGHMKRADYERYLNTIPEADRKGAAEFLNKHSLE